MLYDVQRVERDKDGVPGICTDLITSSKRRMYDRISELQGRRQMCRVVNRYGDILSAEEIRDGR